MLRLAASARHFVICIAFAATGVAAGCAPPCGASEVCAVTGHDADSEVCDGDHWRTCGTDDGDHGLRIACKSSPSTAVCGPSGWTFEDSGTAAASTP